MATIPLPPDFSAFLKLLGEYEVEYLLIGGYAVGYYGYVRATADMDIWIRRDEVNAERMVTVLKEFGFTVPDLNTALFLDPDRIVRMGMPPHRIEIMMSVDGVEFGACYEVREIAAWDDVRVNVISLEHLKQNKRASGRLKDLADLEYLE
jgi:hypothetical protein